MSDQIPRYLDEYSRSLESVPMEPGDTSEPPPTPEVAARSPKAIVIGLSVAATVLAAFAGYELLQAKESERKVTTVETSRKNLESDFKKAMSKKDLEMEEARADSQRLAENLAKEVEKNRILQAHADKTAAALQAKAKASVKSTSRGPAKSVAKVAEEERRSSGKAASRKTSSSVSKSTQHTPSAVERTVVQVPRGPNKGRWYFAAVDGFTSPLYGSRGLALRDAELRARTGY